MSKLNIRHAMSAARQARLMGSIELETEWKHQIQREVFHDKPVIVTEIGANSITYAPQDNPHDIHVVELEAQDASTT